jgi:monovalent cation:H+ antiporter, CPA1 family
MGLRLRPRLAVAQDGVEDGEHLLWWGGLRGALALALALSLPQDLPHREDILIFAFAVAACSVIVQGLTAPYALRRLGLVKGSRRSV